ncbi:MAG TPA: glycosyltransferase family 2 protein, partial [Thalassobaculum sp.]
AHDRGRQALVEPFARRRVAATVEEVPVGRYRRVRYPLPDPAPRVSVIVPTRDRVELLRTAVGSLLEKTDYPDIEVLIVDNGSTEDETRRYFETVTAADPRVRVVTDGGPFNYSRLNNLAAAEATGAVLCLLNNDTEVSHADWLAEMVGHAMRPEVGAVGARLYYGDGRVQHAGVVLGIGGIAGHVFAGLEPGQPGYFSREALTQCYSAVTAACLVTRREIYEQLGGLDEDNLGVAFNDVDYCLRVWESGHSVVWTPFAELYHHESASRGSDEDPTRRARFRKEVQHMRERWQAPIAADPYYNPNLSLAHDDFRLAVPPRSVKPWLKR